MNDKKIKNIELLHFLKDLKTINSQVELPEESFDCMMNHIHKLIGQSQDTIEKRLEGLNIEDEFLLYSLILGNILQVTRLDQKNYTENEFIIPDFLFAVKLPEMNKENLPIAQRFFVEVKKMKEGEEEFIISLKYFEKIKSYAELYSLPLYFAIKMDNKHPAWFLVFADTFEEYGNIEKRKINNRFEKCFVINGVELLNYDYSGLWLSNYLVLVPSGLKIDIKYGNDTSKQKTYNDIINLKMTYENEFKEALFEVENKVIDSVFLKICNYLKACNIIEGGYKELIEEDDEKIIKWQTNIDFFILYYHLILTCYLYLKNECERGKNPENINNIPYYLKTLSDFDNNLVMMIKYIIREMAQKNMLKPIKMIPKSTPEG